MKIFPIEADSKCKLVTQKLHAIIHIRQSLKKKKKFHEQNALANILKDNLKSIHIFIVGQKQIFFFFFLFYFILLHFNLFYLLLLTTFL